MLQLAIITVLLLTAVLLITCQLARARAAAARAPLIIAFFDQLQRAARAASLSEDATVRQQGRDELVLLAGRANQTPLLRTATVATPLRAAAAAAAQTGLQ